MYRLRQFLPNSEDNFKVFERTHNNTKVPEYRQLETKLTLVVKYLRRLFTVEATVLEQITKIKSKTRLQACGVQMPTSIVASRMPSIALSTTFTQDAGPMSSHVAVVFLW
jgi:hypothetical protein